MTEDIPGPWKVAAEAKGIRPSYRALGDRAGLAHETVRRVARGQSVSKESVRKLADALGVDVEKIHMWRDEAVPDYAAEFHPDPASSLLTVEERAAVNTLIRMLTAGRGEQDAGGVEGVRMHARTPRVPLPGSPSRERR